LKGDDEVSTDSTQQPHQPAGETGLTTNEGFATLQRVATMFSKSTLVPTQFQNNIANCSIAVHMALRMGADPLMVMQNLYVVHGRPGWSSQFLIACFNKCGRFSAMRFEWQGKKSDKDWGCRAWAIEKETGERVYGAWITFAMADSEGWVKKSGSKWQTMPEQMLMYRAAAFFTRAYAPELTMGLHTAEEVEDISSATPTDTGRRKLDSLIEVPATVLPPETSAAAVEEADQPPVSSEPASRFEDCVKAIGECVGAGELDYLAANMMVDYSLTSAEAAQAMDMVQQRRESLGLTEPKGKGDKQQKTLM